MVNPYDKSCVSRNCVCNTIADNFHEFAERSFIKKSLKLNSKKL